MPLFRVKAANIFEGYKFIEFSLQRQAQTSKILVETPKQNNIHFFFVPVAGKYIKDAERDGWEKFNCEMQIINSRPRQ